MSVNRLHAHGSKSKRMLLHGVFDTKVFGQLKKNGVKEVFVLEGRPSLDSGRRLCRELLKVKIKPVIISDNMAGFLFARDMVKDVWMSYQIMDQKGAVCRIGALILAVLATYHHVPVSVFKSSVRTKFMGKPEDLFYFNGERVAPAGIKAYVPLVEWVPQKYIKEYHG